MPSARRIAIVCLASRPASSASTCPRRPMTTRRRSRIVHVHLVVCCCIQVPYQALTRERSVGHSALLRVAGVVCSTHGCRFKLRAVIGRLLLCCRFSVIAQGVAPCQKLHVVHQVACQGCCSGHCRMSGVLWTCSIISGGLLDDCPRSDGSELLVICAWLWFIVG